MNEYEENLAFARQVAYQTMKAIKYGIVRFSFGWQGRIYVIELPKENPLG